MMMRVVYGTDADDYFDYEYDATTNRSLTHGRMIALDRDLRNMVVSESDIENVLKDITDFDFSDDA